MSDVSRGFPGVPVLKFSMSGRQDDTLRYKTGCHLPRRLSTLARMGNPDHILVVDDDRVCATAGPILCRQRLSGHYGGQRPADARGSHKPPDRSDRARPHAAGGRRPHALPQPARAINPMTFRS